MQEILSWITWVDIVGYIGALATLWGFNQRTIIPLRIWSIVGNVGLIIFGAMASSYPPLVLHVILLPLNTYRLHQSLQLVKDIQAASNGDGNLNALIPFMVEQNYKAGDVLFHKGDIPYNMIIIAEGTVRLKEVNVDCGSGDVLGEIAAFTPDNARTCTATCTTDVCLYTLDNETMLQLFHQNPRFGIYLVRLIVNRLQGNWAEAETGK